MKGKSSQDISTVIPHSRMVEVQRTVTKKHKLGIENSKLSKESEVLKIIKNSNHDLEDFDLIDKCMVKNIFLRNLETQARKEVIKQMCYCFVPADTVVFNQGAIGNYFYIIKEGKVDLIIDGEQKKTLRYGDSFGELALLHGALRSGTIKTLQETHMWCLERKKFKQVVDYINNKNFEENRAFIQSIPILNNMNLDTISLLCSNLVKEIYDPGNYIVKEGETADCIYIIKEGNVDVSTKEEVVRTLRKGDFFGVNSILAESTRTMNVIAKSICACYSISVGTLTNILGPNFKDVLYINFIKVAMKNSLNFSKLNGALIEGAYRSFTVKRFSGGDLVISKGSTIDNKIIIIIEGSLITSYDINFSFKNSSSDNRGEYIRTNSLEKVKFAERGKIMFEEEIKNRGNGKPNPILQFNLIADPDCFLLEADIEEFTKYLGGSIQDISEKSGLIDSLSKIPLFKNFNEKQINSFANQVEIEEFKKDEKIINEGEEGSKFYIVRTGKVNIYIDNKYTRTLNENEYFGEKSLFIKEPRSATVIAGDNNVSLYVFGQEIFKNIEENLRDFIIHRITLQDNTIKLQDLEYISTLGKGNFGNVFLVSCKKNNCLYALKAISKYQIDEEQLHSNMDMERQVLLQIDHPFIMKMVKSLKDDHDIYFLTEYIRGKELWDVIRDIGLLNKQQTLFYACSIMMAVDYLHKRKFIYRDIKPENVLVNEQVKYR